MLFRLLLRLGWNRPLANLLDRGMQSWPDPLRSPAKEAGAACALSFTASGRSRFTRPTCPA